MSSSRIDVSIEHRGAPEPSGKKHPNTCPQCDSHYRDDELDANLWVCRQCGHHFPMKARARISSLADDGTFVEEAAAAVKIFAFDEVPAHLKGHAEVTYWSDVPPAIKDYMAARHAIVRHLFEVVGSMTPDH